MKLSTVPLKPGRMYISFSYEELKVSKNILPIFISLRPDRKFIVEGLSESSNLLTDLKNIREGAKLAGALNQDTLMIIAEHLNIQVNISLQFVVRIGHNYLVKL
jgi:hypothetical protein